MSVFKTFSNPLVGGIFLGLFAILLEFHDIPLEIAGGLDLYSSSGNPLFFIILGIIGGSFISSTFTQEFGIKIPTKIEIFKAVVAGILMGIGSTLALGGNIGGFYTATANFSASGLTMFLGLIIGVLMGLKYLIWEAEKFPSKGGINIYLKKFGTVIGIIVLIIILWKALGYLKSNTEKEILGKLLLFSAIAGFIIQRSKLCMAKAFREPFISGDSLMTRSFVLSLFIATTGIFFLKFSKIQDPYFYVIPTFVLGSFVGGILFGLGMVLADSCALSMLWKLGEGQLKLLIVTVFFGLSTSIFRYYLEHVWNIWEKGFLGKKVYLPDYLTYPGAFLLVLVVLFLWIFFVEWNRRTRRFIIKI